MKFIFILIFIGLIVLTVFSQDEKKMDSSESKKEMPTDEAEVLKVVVHLFGGMRAGDSSMVSSCFMSRLICILTTPIKKEKQLL
jgi:hypothetical protein